MTRPYAKVGDGPAGDPASAVDSCVAYCPECERQRPHDVAVGLLRTDTETTADGNRKFARCPGRILTCRVCGAETRSLANR